MDVSCMRSGMKKRMARLFYFTGEGATGKGKNKGKRKRGGGTFGKKRENSEPEKVITRTNIAIPGDP